jgi:hypothetical protein
MSRFGLSARSFRWYTIELLDGARLERQAGKTFIPSAVRLPADAPPTSDDTLNEQRGRRAPEQTAAALHLVLH